MSMSSLLGKFFSLKPFNIERPCFDHQNIWLWVHARVDRVRSFANSHLPWLAHWPRGARACSNRQQPELQSTCGSNNHQQWIRARWQRASIWKYVSVHWLIWIRLTDFHLKQCSLHKSFWRKLLPNWPITGFPNLFSMWMKTRCAFFSVTITSSRCTNIK